MTKVTMPRAVGFVTRDTSQADMDAELSEGTPLITTTQAEAYKDACVREVLEEAAQLCQSEGDEWDSDGVVTNKNYAHACRDRIRTLIPKQ